MKEVTPKDCHHFVLFDDDTIYDLYDPLVWKGDVDETIRQLSALHGAGIKFATTVYDLFATIKGLHKIRGFENIGRSNWNKLFWVRGEYEYYLGYLLSVEKGLYLVARSTDSFVWTFNVIDA